MGRYFSGLASVVDVAPMRVARGSSSQAMQTAFWAGEPVDWFDQLIAAGVTITPELAMTLSAYYGGVTTISYDLATLPWQVFKYRDDGGKDRVRAGHNSLGSGGIGNLVYMLRWQPNAWQTSTEFLLAMFAQFLLREVAYAEIVPGPNGFLEQLLPRHPDRVTPERLPNGRLRYKLIEANGQPRYLTQDEMFAVRGLSLDGGLTMLSRVRAGGQAIMTALAAEAAAGKFFRSGMTAAKVATYKGDMDPEDEDKLHQSITRFATGVENNFGLMLIPDDVTITNLGIEPEKAQMMLAREWGIREVARHLRMPGHKLGIKDANAYASQVQAAIDYVISCLRPVAIIFEQAAQRDLILAKDTYFTEIKLEALLRGDPQAQAEYIERLIKVRVMRPSEGRLLLNMNPDPRLDELSESDFRPGATAATGGGQRAESHEGPVRGEVLSRSSYKALLAVHDNAIRCLRRERAAVERLARKFASDVEGWKSGLREFYADHATFIAQTMRISPVLAGGYAAQHGSAFEAKGVVLIAGEAGAEWERFEADELAAIALSQEETLSISISMPTTKVTRTPVRDASGRITRVEEVTEVVESATVNGVTVVMPTTKVIRTPVRDASGRITRVDEVTEVVEPAAGPTLSARAPRQEASLVDAS